MYLILLDITRLVLCWLLLFLYFFYRTRSHVNEHIISNFHISHNASYLHPSSPPPPTPKKKKIFGNLCFSFLLGITGVPREIENNAYAKFGEQIRCIMGDVEVAYELLNVTWLNKYDSFVKLAPSFLCSFNWLTRRWVEKIILPLARS